VDLVEIVFFEHKDYFFTVYSRQLAVMSDFYSHISLKKEVKIINLGLIFGFPPKIISISKI
jgi:hypothetical protein